MLQHRTSVIPSPSVRAGSCLGTLAASMLLWGCATGVDVSNSDLAEICSNSDVVCGSGATAASAGASGAPSSIGTSGSSNSGGTSNQAATVGTQNNTVNNAAGGSSNSSTSNGSSGSNGSSATNGSAGSGAALTPLAKGNCMPADQDKIVIDYTDRGNGKTSDSQASMVLRIDNTGPSFSLADLTIRYWFTDDGLSGFTDDIDYASAGGGGGDLKGSMNVTFAKDSGSNYALIAFSATDMIPTQTDDGQPPNQIQLRIHTDDYKMFDQSNDFSYQGSASDVPNRNITPYLSGVQAGGCVPSAQ